MRHYKYDNVADAYQALLQDLMINPDYENSPRGQKIKEITNAVVEIKHPYNNLFINNKRSSPIKYICAELLWYFSGSNTTEFISKYASMWEKLKNSDGTVNSAYGYLLFSDKNEYGFSQYQWALESLKKDKDTRQAFIHFNNSKHQFFGNKDQVCTMYGIFQIRDNFLNFTVNMRSNDAVLGFMTDFAFFNILHQQLYNHLLHYYPELQFGSYTHFSNSMHIYEKNFSLVNEMLLHPFDNDAAPILDCNLVSEDGTPISFNDIKNSNFIKFVNLHI